MRRLAITLLVAPFAGLVGLSLLGGNASAGTTVPPDTVLSTDAPAAGGDGATATELAPVDVLQVSGLFDGVTVQSVKDAIARSESNGSQALILQLNTGGAVVSTQEMTSLLQRVADAKVAIGVWVGPSRDARAYGLPAQLFGVADVTAMVAPLITFFMFSLSVPPLLRTTSPIFSSLLSDFSLKTMFLEPPPMINAIFSIF